MTDSLLLSTLTLHLVEDSVEYTLARINSSVSTEVKLREEQNKAEEVARLGLNKLNREKREKAKEEKMAAQEPVNKPRWTTQDEVLLPNFDLVRRNSRTVKWWCESATTVISSFLAKQTTAG